MRLNINRLTPDKFATGFVLFSSLLTLSMGMWSHSQVGLQVSGQQI